MSTLRRKQALTSKISHKIRFESGTTCVCTPSHAIAAQKLNWEAQRRKLSGKLQTFAISGSLRSISTPLHKIFKKQKTETILSSLAATVITKMTWKANDHI